MNGERRSRAAARMSANPTFLLLPEYSLLNYYRGIKREVPDYPHIRLVPDFVPSLDDVQQVLECVLLRGGKLALGNLDVLLAVHHCLFLLRADLLFCLLVPRRQRGFLLLYCGDEVL